MASSTGGSRAPTVSPVPTGHRGQQRQLGAGGGNWILPRGRSQGRPARNGCNVKGAAETGAGSDVMVSRSWFKR